MALRSVISGGALGLRRRLWSGESSSLRSFISQSAAAAAEPAPAISVAFLVDSCGLSPDSAAFSIKKLDLSVNPKASRNPEAVFELFRSRGFSVAQIARIVAIQPGVLFSDAEGTLKPKLDYLRAEGFCQKDIAKMFNSLPGSLEKRIKPNVGILRTFLPSNTDIAVAVKRSRCLLRTDLKKTMLPNLETVRAIGVPEKRISQLIVMDAMALTRSPRSFDEYIEMLKGIGISHTSYNYILALSYFNKLSRATLRKKMSFFSKVGFTEEDFFFAFRRAPQIASLSEQSIRKKVGLFKGFGLRDDEIPSFVGKYAAIFVLSEQNIAKSMDFLVRTFNWNPRDILKSSILGLSLERRLIPRAFVVSTLLTKGLLSRDRIGFFFFVVGEDKFVVDYVTKFQDELPQLLEEYLKLKAKGVQVSVGKVSQ